MYECLLVAIKITDNIKTWGPDLEKVHHANFLTEIKIRCRLYKTQVSTLHSVKKRKLVASQNSKFIGV